MTPPRTHRPFKGNTPEKMFQVMDIGGGEFASRLKKMARKNPGRKYALVDHRPTFISRENIRTYKKKALEAMDDAIKEGLRFRHVRMMMPLGNLQNPGYIKKMLKRAKKLMLPGGKIFIGTDNSFAYTDIRQLFKEEGFILGKRKKLHPAEWSHDMHQMSREMKKANWSEKAQFFGLVATYSQKAARNEKRKS